MGKKRIVIKIGSHLLANEDGFINYSIIENIVNDISQLHKQGHNIIIVSSGAIASGIVCLKLEQKPKTLPEKQAIAAVGQPILMQIYQKEFSQYNIKVAQLLLTREDFEDRNRYLNIRNTVSCLLNLGIIPIINENDTISVEEIKFGDNDTLSALVASKIDADLLVLLTDVEGLFDDDPNKNKNAKLITNIKEITSEIEAIAKKTAGSILGTGGMYSKIQAAKIATSSGVEVVIADGRKSKILEKILNGEEVGTRFFASQAFLTARKRWIAFGSRVKGKIKIDNGAVDALLKKGKSLLPSGIISVEGNFNSGDTVEILDISGSSIARGLVNYSSEEINKIKGKKTSEISKILGKCDFEEVIHRDNLALL
ncbi:MAG: glutamate 5-kinase [Endomicrobiia bacterium]